MRSGVFKKVNDCGKAPPPPSPYNLENCFIKCQHSSIIPKPTMFACSS